MKLSPSTQRNLWIASTSLVIALVFSQPFALAVLAAISGPIISHATLTRRSFTLTVGASFMVALILACAQTPLQAPAVFYLIAFCFGFYGCMAVGAVEFWHGIFNDAYENYKADAAAAKESEDHSKTNDK